MKVSRPYLIGAAAFVLYGLLWLVFHDTPAHFVEWDIPTDPFEKQAYDFAHSIKLPDSVPKPEPFKFCKLEVLGLCLGKATSEEYFDHLCKTEAGDYIFKTANEVEGLYLMRPKSKGTDYDYTNRYGPEDPTDYFANSLGATVTLANIGEKFIQPEYNHYKYVDVHYKGWKDGVSKILHIYRDVGTTRKKHYVFWKRKWFPDVIAVRESERSEARYAAIWRGIRREHDREYGIAGAEVVVLDRDSNSVMALRRVFARTQVKRVDLGVRWDTAMSCPPVFHQTHNSAFIPSVLRPVVEDINGDDHE